MLVGGYILIRIGYRFVASHTFIMSRTSITIMARFINRIRVKIILYFLLRQEINCNEHIIVNRTKELKLYEFDENELGESGVTDTFKNITALWKGSRWNVH